jgi:hypothetical protein
MFSLFVNKGDNKDSSARINFKQAIIVALITSLTTIIVTLISTGGNKSNQNSQSLDCDLYREKIEELNAELDISVSAENLSDISNTFFNKVDSEQVLKDSTRNVVLLTQTHLNDKKHYTYNLCLLKKILLNKPRGNINTRIESDDVGTYALIQQILKNIYFYAGPVSGNRQDTYMELRGFQLKLNEATKNYFEESNLGILGNKTYIALMEYYELTN